MRFFTILLIAAGVFFPSDSVFAQATTGGGGTGGASLAVDLTLAPDPVVWGHLIGLSSTVTGGTPNYTIIHSVRCPGAAVAAGTSTTLTYDPTFGPAVSYWPTKVVGFKIAKSDATDSIGLTGFKEETFEVLPPDKVEVEPAAITGIEFQVNTTSQNGNAFSFGIYQIKFEVKRGTELVGPHATAIIANSGR